MERWRKNSGLVNFRFMNNLFYHLSWWFFVSRLNYQIHDDRQIFDNYECGQKCYGRVHA